MSTFFIAENYQFIIQKLKLKTSTIVDKFHL